MVKSTGIKQCAVSVPGIIAAIFYLFLRTIPDIVRFEVLMAASMKMAVFWVVAPCSLVEVTDIS
jgi:hypothetical protein